MSFKTQILNNKYDISKYGFLPEKCTDEVPQKFRFYNSIIKLVKEKDSSGAELRKRIEDLPKYDKNYHHTNDLNESELKYLYSILSMIINKYVWCTGVDDAKHFAEIPDILGCVYYEVSQKLGIAMSLTHAAVDLWNWKSTKDDSFELDSFDTINTMTGTDDESWFYKIMISIEGKGGRLLEEIHDMALNHSKKNNEQLHKFINSLMLNIDDLTLTVKKMYKNCDPSFFFNKLRIFLSGSDNEFLKDGLTLHTPEGKKVIIKNKGGSAAQSTLIQVYDALFGITHTGKSKQYLDEMCNYMPKKHELFLSEIKKSNLRNDIKSRYDYLLSCKFNDCIDSIKRFREAHLGLVRTYIMKFVDTNENNNNNAHGNKGSGGTSPVDFCSELIIDSQDKIRPLDSKYLDIETYKLPIMFVITGLIMWYLWHK